MSQKHITLAIGLLIFVALGFSGGLLNIAWTYMQVSFGVELDRLGVLLLFATTGSLIAAFGSGALVGRWGLGAVVIAGAVLATGGLIAMGLSPVWPALLAAIFVMHIGRGALDAGMNNFVSENYGAWAVNLLHACWGAGLTIAPGVLTVLVVRENTSWRTGYLLLAVAFAVVLALVIAVRRQWDVPESTDAPPRARYSMRRSLGEPAVWAGVFVFFIYGGLEIGIGQLANTLLVEGRGTSQPVASSWLSAYWGTFTVGRLAVGLIALRVAPRKIVLGGLAMALAGAAGLAVPGRLALNLMGLVLCGAGLAGFFPLLTSLTPSRVGFGHSANAIGFQVGSAGMGAAILPGAVSAVAGTTGLEAIGIGLLVNAVVLLGAYPLLRVASVDVQPAPPPAGGN